MANKDYGQTYFATDASAVDVAAISEAAAESLEGRTVVSFGSTGARDTAFATLTTEQKKGVIAHVMGMGLYYYTGATWKRVSAEGENFVQSAITGVTTGGIGQFSVYYPVPFGSGAMPVVVANHVTGSVVNAPLFVRQDNASTTNTFFFAHVTNLDGSLYTNQFLHVSWIAHGPRAAD